jgi:hypothetical protein
MDRPSVFSDRSAQAPRGNLNHALSVAVCLPIFWAVPAAAHTIHTSGKVAAIFHIEPGHNPKAGEPSTAWFALTKQGGDRIPLTNCTCTLTVYDTATQKPVLQPPLKAIAAERFQDIPGATLIFPKSGIYDLKLKGTSTNGDEFPPFELSYQVTVQAGKAPVDVSQAHALNLHSVPPTNSPTSGQVLGWGAGLAIVGLLGGIVWRWRRGQ